MLDKHRLLLFSILGLKNILKSEIILWKYTHTESIVSGQPVKLSQSERNHHPTQETEREATAKSAAKHSFGNLATGQMELSTKLPCCALFDSPSDTS